MDTRSQPPELVWLLPCRSLSLSSSEMLDIWDWLPNVNPQPSRRCWSRWKQTIPRAPLLGTPCMVGPEARARLTCHQDQLIPHRPGALEMTRTPAKLILLLSPRTLTCSPQGCR